MEKRSRIHLTHFSMRSTRFPARHPGPESAPPNSRRSHSSPTALCGPGCRAGKRVEHIEKCVRCILLRFPSCCFFVPATIFS